MFQIVSGEVEFSTPRPFESKSARVKLSFTVDPGMNAEEATALVGAMAKNRAEGMISDKPIGGLVSIEAAPVPPTKRKPPVAVASPVEPLAGEANPFGATTQVVPSSDAAPSGPSPSPASVTLTDKAMQEACADKVNKADPAARDALKAKVIALIKSNIAEGGPVTVIAVPAEKRAAFLAELAALV